MSRSLRNTLVFNRPTTIGARGFTLLEVMVAVAVISIVLVSILKLQGQTIRMNETVRFYALAPMLAGARLTDLLLKPENAEGSLSGDFGEDYPGYTWTAEVEKLTIEVINSASLELKKIDIVVLLNEGEMRFSLRRYINNASATEE